MLDYRDLLPDDEPEWTCGHRAGAVCAICFAELARKAHELAVENEELADEIARLRQGLNMTHRNPRGRYPS